ncbi:MAG: hypothetical protein JSU74_06050 [Candidatus Zixiibacteriota bacterium]|nr:MAG: hypothetical protein JSU74_06050 [candidate division Zixibacteria bacterium]
MFRESDSTLGQAVINHRVAIAITLIVSVLSFFLHLKWCGSMMQLEESVFSEILSIHQDGYPFAARYLTTTSIILMSGLGLTIKSSYFLLQYTLMVFLGLVFYRYLLALDFSKNLANLGLFVLLSSYPVLAAYIEPVHTWDDLWAHSFLVLSFTSLMRSNPTGGLIWFAGACFAREQSLLFLPVFLIAIHRFCHVQTPWRIILFGAIPLVVIGVIHALAWQTPEPGQFSLFGFNFESPLRTSDTLFSLFISFGFMWFLVLIGLLRRRDSEENQLLYWGTIITVPLTIIIVLFFARARETRLFFPPFIFVIPICVMALKSIYANLTARLTRSGWILALAVFVVFMAVGIVAGQAAFPEFEYRRCPNFQRLWAGIHFGLILNLAACTMLWGLSGLAPGGKSAPDPTIDRSAS